MRGSALRPRLLPAPWASTLSRSPARSCGAPQTPRLPLPSQLRSRRLGTTRPQSSSSGTCHPLWTARSLQVSRHPTTAFVRWERDPLLGVAKESCSCRSQSGEGRLSDEDGTPLKSPADGLIQRCNPFCRKSGAGDNGAMRLAAALSDSLACPAAEGAGPVLLVATAASASDVPPALRRCFTHELTAGGFLTITQQFKCRCAAKRV